MPIVLKSGSLNLLECVNKSDKPSHSLPPGRHNLYMSYQLNLGCGEVPVIWWQSSNRDSMARLPKHGAVPSTRPRYAVFKKTGLGWDWFGAWSLSVTCIVLTQFPKNISDMATTLIDDTGFIAVTRLGYWESNSLDAIHRPTTKSYSKAQNWLIHSVLALSIFL
jgi:hypothetical protein